ncbi:hypothetical protein EDD16DRAFT_1710840 [Pisolithus croceorrhizus]|nr:hypothetical protein EDD16DRAFT_1710840 [Pisolithus croceorrhizus]KAI6163957.1 hypothetical protein EDD17DRAFT_1755538 [Pisolithus thermaeus]
MNIGSKSEGMQDEDDNDHDSDNSSDTQFTNWIMPTELSGRTRHPLTFHNSKVPKTPHISASTIQALEANHDMDGENHTISSSVSMKQKRLKDKCMEATPGEPEGVKITGKCYQSAEPKRQCETDPENEDTISVKAQKLTEHEGHPHAKDYDDVTQEFLTTAVTEY